MGSYNSVSKWFHWVTVVLLAMAMPVGFVIGHIKDADKGIFYAIHESAGLTILLVVVARLTWRLMNPPPPLSEQIPLPLRKIAAGVHHTLYAMLILQPVLGFIATNAWGFPMRGGSAYLGFIDLPKFMETNEPTGRRHPDRAHHRRLDHPGAAGAAYRRRGVPPGNPAGRPPAADDLSRYSGFCGFLEQPGEESGLFRRRRDLGGFAATARSASASLAFRVSHLSRLMPGLGSPFRLIGALGLGHLALIHGNSSGSPSAARCGRGSSPRQAGACRTRRDGPYARHGTTREGRHLGLDGVAAGRYGRAQRRGARGRGIPNSGGILCVLRGREGSRARPGAGCRGRAGLAARHRGAPVDEATRTPMSRVR